MNYTELVNTISPNSIVTFKEFVLNRREQKLLSLLVEQAVVKEVWKPNQNLPIDVLRQYYGEELDTLTYRQLASSSDLRLVLSIGINEYNEEQVKVITINQDFVNLGLQVIEAIIPSQQDEPNYMRSVMGGF